MNQTEQEVAEDGIIRPNSRGDGPRRSSSGIDLNTSGPVTSGTAGPRGNPNRVFPRQTKSATTNSQVENSLKRKRFNFENLRLTSLKMVGQRGPKTKK